MENPIIENVLSAGWEAELNKLSKVLDDLAAKAEKINVGLGKKGSGNNAAAVKEMMEIQKQYAESLKKIAQLEEQLLNLRKTSKQLTMQEKVEKQSLNMVSKLEEQAANQNIDALTRLNAQHKLAAVNYANLSQKVGVTTKELDAAKNKMVETTSALIKLNTGTVGVKSGMNNAYNSTFQMTQVMRELPNFAIDARIGFMSLSNNLPMLYDGFKQLATQIDAVTGKQKGWGFAWKTMGASLLSMNTAMILGVTLLTLYGKEVINWIGTLFKGEKQAGSFASQMDAVNKVMKDGTVKSQLSNFEELGVILNKAKEGTYDAKSAVEKYNETLGDQYGKVEDVNSALIGYKKYGQDYVNSTIAMAAATEVMSEATDSFIEKFKAQQELKNISNLGELNKLYSEFTKSAFKAGATATDINHAIDSSYRGTVKLGAEAAKMLGQLAVSKNGAEYLDLMARMQNATIKINGVQKTASALMSKVSLDFTKSSKDTKTSTKETEVAFNDARIALEKLAAEADNLQIDLGGDGFSFIPEEKVKGLKDRLNEAGQIIRDFNEETLRQAKQAEEERQKLEEDKAQLRWDIARTSVDAIAQLGDSLLQSQIDNLDEQNEAYKKSYDERIMQIEGMGLSEEETTKEKAAAEAYYQSQLEQTKQREKELQREQFLLNQLAALAQVAINTAINITSPENIGGLLTPYYVAIGAAQAAVIAAQTIPAFAEGGKITDSPNIQTRPNGDNILAYVSRGETILNNDQVMALGGAWAMKQAGVPGYEDARYQPDMTDIRAGYNGKTGKIIVNANFESERIVKELKDIKFALTKDKSSTLMDTLKMQRYAKR